MLDAPSGRSMAMKCVGNEGASIPIHQSKSSMSRGGTYCSRGRSRLGMATVHNRKCRCRTAVYPLVANQWVLHATCSKMAGTRGGEGHTHRGLACGHLTLPLPPPSLPAAACHLRPSLPLHCRACAPQLHSALCPHGHAAFCTCSSSPCQPIRSQLITRAGLARISHLRAHRASPMSTS